MTAPQKRSRGRPKKYDWQVALNGAMTVFWAKGYSGVSLDDLSDAMDMNRPSIYRAFGDKETIFRLSLEQFGESVLSGLEPLKNSQRPFQEDLEDLFANAIQVYCQGEEPLGCFLACTAPVEAISQPALKEQVLVLIKRLDRAFRVRVEQAIKDGDLSASVDATFVAQLIHGVLHTLAVRSRSGQSKRSLIKFAQSAARLLSSSG